MNLLVSAISGNLGQSVCKTIRKHFADANITGVDSLNPLQGFGLCNNIIKVPFAVDENYIESILQIVKQKEIDIIIPCNDFEVEILNANEYLNRRTLTTKFKSNSNIFDKYLCFKEFEKLQIGFCNSYLPSNYTLDFENIILKPRRGSGSKGIVKNPSNILDFDDKYIIQDLKKGLELTIPFYVNLNHILLGFLPLIKFGTAPNNSYQTYTKLNEEIQTILLKIIEAFEIKGPCNLQCIVNDDGIHPFEMNFRYSGSIDIQDQLGFDILRIGITEFISNKAYSEKPKIFNGFAVRQYHSEVFINKDIFSETDFTHE